MSTIKLPNDHAKRAEYEARDTAQIAALVRGLFAKRARCSCGNVAVAFSHINPTNKTYKAYCERHTPGPKAKAWTRSKADEALASRVVALLRDVHADTDEA